MKKSLSIDLLKQEAELFARQESQHKEKALFGVTDGKAVGTYLEYKFQSQLNVKYERSSGSAAKGIDFPELNVDIKVTSIRQPQSSCPFSSARQKIYGLGYSLLVFVYEKKDDLKAKTSTLEIKHVLFIERDRTADFQTTNGLVKILENEGNIEDIAAYLTERFLPVDEIQMEKLAAEILSNPPKIGYLTISNALQWRLQYSRAIEQAGRISGLQRII